MINKSGEKLEKGWRLGQTVQVFKKNEHDKSTQPWIIHREDLN